MVKDNYVAEGSYILLYFSSRKKWLVKVDAEKVLHTHLGMVNLGDVVGKEYGSHIESTLAQRLWILKPTVEDFVLKGERKTQVLYPKDLGYLAAKTGVSSGCIVVEAGTGSGALTTFLANLVKPSGHIYSYEIRPEFIEVAEKNLRRAGLREYVTIENRDAKEGVDVDDADLAVIDVGDPWTLVEPMRNALKSGHYLVAVCPTMNQCERLVSELESHGFIDTVAVEILLRNVEARAGKTRPATRMVGHTAYLIFSRKIIVADE